MSALRIAHVITDLGAGGAEGALVQLATRGCGAGLRPFVFALGRGGLNETRLLEAGVPTICLGMRPGQPDPRASLTLTRQLRHLAPDVVQTWMYHADLVGGVAARAAGVPSVVWNLRNSTLPTHASLATRAVVQACARLSSIVPTRIVSCSQVGLENHAAQGWPVERMTFIPNGVDTDRFRPDPDARARLRRALAVSDDDVVLGLSARFAPEKDHACFLEATAALRRRGRPVVPVLFGEGTDTSEELRRVIAGHGLEREVRRLGVRTDVPALLNAVDIAVSSSRSIEGMSNAVLEAMATALPVVATDVGDARLMLGDAGAVVPAQSPLALADALDRLVLGDGAQRRALGARARARVGKRFSLAGFVSNYRNLYQELAPHVRNRRAL